MFLLRSAVAPATAADPATRAGRRIRHLTTMEELERFRATWAETPLGRFDADPDFYLALAASRPSFVRPHLVVVERDGELEALVVARVEDTRLPTSFGYVSILRRKLRSITVPHGGIYGATDELAPLLISELRKTLAAGDADVLWIPAQRVGSPLHQAALATVPALLREPRTPVSTHRRLELADSYEEFLRSRSKSSRESAKRYRKKVERELGDRLRLRVFRDPADIDRIFTDTEPVAAQTYQRALGVALADTPQQRALIGVGLRRGWFRCYVAYLDGRPIAFWPGYGYDGTFYVGTPGYDPACADLRIGTYLLVRMIEDFCADPSLRTVDYGFGDAEYKRRYATESWEEADIRIFAPAPRTVALRLLVSALGALARAATGVLERTGQLEKLKRAWRRRLALRAAAPR